MKDHSLAIKTKIVELFNQGLQSNRAISRNLSIPRQTVDRIVKKFRENDSILSKRFRRKPTNVILSETARRLIRRKSIQCPKASARQVRAMCGGPVASASVRTMQRTLLQMGRLAYRPRAGPCLTQARKQNRLKWCREHLHWSKDDWAKVIFSDEAMIELCSPKSRYVRRSRDEMVSDSHCKHVKAFTKKILIWGCFNSAGLGCLRIVPSSMTTSSYIYTLQNHLIPSIDLWFTDPTECIFQHDNAPCHKSKETTQFLRTSNFAVLTWPTYSPDLNPIENLWAILKRKIHQRSYESLEELKEVVHHLWCHDETIKSTAKALSDSMPKRIRNCIVARGGPIKY